MRNFRSERNSQDYSREERVFLTFGLLILASALISVFYPLISLLVLLSGTTFVLAHRFFLPIIIFLPAYIPFQIALNPSSEIDLASGRVIILLLLIIFFFKIIAQKKPWLHLSHLSLALIFFLVWSTLSFLGAEDGGRFFRKILVFLSIFPIFFIAGTMLK